MLILTNFDSFAETKEPGTSFQALFFVELFYEIISFEI